MSYGYVPSVGAILFVSTILVIILHVLEWFQIGTMPPIRFGNAQPGKHVSKLPVLRGAMGVEMAYYFLLLVAFVLFLPGDLIFLTLIAVIGLAHLVAFWALMGETASAWFRDLTKHTVSKILAFDVVELVVLLVLALRFYGSLHAG
jgi:hypothetical protein